MRIGFSIYGGWVNSATIVNVASCLVSWGVKDGSMAWTEEGFTCLMLCIALLIYVAFMIKNEDPVFGLIFIWVCVAIINARPE